MVRTGCIIPRNTFGKEIWNENMVINVDSTILINYLKAIKQPWEVNNLARNISTEMDHFDAVDITIRKEMH